MFSISKNIIDPAVFSASFADNRAGAFVTFEGWVRDHNEGNQVAMQEYESYEELCPTEAKLISIEAHEKFVVIEICCVHRVGELQFGEIAVWVAASAAHRGDASTACRDVIDKIKSRLPIWKKETYVNGALGWVNCQSYCQQTDSDKEASIAASR